jgi:hypothetical protein
MTPELEAAKKIVKGLIWMLREVAWSNQDSERTILCDNAFKALALLVSEIEADAKTIAELREAGNRMYAFILTWRDCLEGVQMNENDFKQTCGLARWAALAKGKG